MVRAKSAFSATATTNILRLTSVTLGCLFSIRIIANLIAEQNISLYRPYSASEPSKLIANISQHFNSVLIELIGVATTSNCYAWKKRLKTAKV